MSDEFEIISSYTDEQAVEDGMIIPIGHLRISLDGKIIDRITTALWVELTNKVTKLDDGSLNQVELELAIMDLMDVADSKQDMFVMKTPYGPVWACLNERNRWTLMFPSDY